MKEKYLYIAVGVLVVVGVVVASILTRPAEEGVIIFENDDVEVEVPEQSVAVVYFGNETRDSSFRCTRVFPVEHAVVGELTYENALRALLDGLTLNEREEGYFTSLPNDVQVISTLLEEEVLTVTFSTELDQVAGSCRVEAIRSQIEQTLFEFEEVTEVVIQTETRSPGESLQP